MRCLSITIATATLALGAWAAPAVAAAHPRHLARLAFPAQLPNRTVTVPILMYHRIGPVPPDPGPYTVGLTVSPSLFAAQMRWLHAHGYHAITQQQLFDALEWGASLPPRPVMITFDDGYRDVLWQAAPVLSRLHMPATAYVITDRISAGDTSFLTWHELVLLERHGFEIGSHTVHHLDLTTLSPTEALQELVQSRRALERHLGRPVRWFSYPAGAEDPQVVALARHTGYLLAVTTSPGATQSARAPLLLHRYEVLHGTSPAALGAMLGGR